MTEEKLGIIVMGAMGRMGRAVLRAGLGDPQVEVTGAVEAPGTPFIGRDTGIGGIELKVTDDPGSVARPGRVIIDFTTPGATMETLKTAVETGCKMVTGTTGMSREDIQALKSAAAGIAVVYSPNMSMGINLLFKLTQLAGGSLGEGFDAEIVEAHHRHKKDAPSGTARLLAQALASGRSLDLERAAVYGRRGMTEGRSRDEIGIHAVRGGDIVGDHTVLFAGEGERIELRHMAHSRMTFANGALKAARFLRDRKSGFFSMFDVLGLA